MTLRTLRPNVAVAWLTFAAFLTACTSGSGSPALTSRSPSAPVASPSPAGLASPTASSASTPSVHLAAAQTMDDAGATRLTVALPADWMAVAGGSAWAAVPGAIQRLDGSDGSVLASILVPGDICLGMDVGFDGVWVGADRADSPSLVRIDVATNRIVAAIPLKIASLQCESSVGAGEGAVWAISVAPTRVLVKIDPATNAVTATFPMPPEHLGGVRAGYGGVWIADQGKDALLRVSPADGSIVAQIPIGSGSGPRFLAIGENAIWVLNQTDGTVSRINPKTDGVVATIRVSQSSIDGGDIAVGCGAIWARTSDELVARIDPAKNEVVARYGPPAGSGGVACADGTAWISAHDVNAVWRLPLR